MADLITDMLNRIRNAQAVSKETVAVPFSKINVEIARVLEENHFIEKADKKGRKDKRTIDIVLKYEKDPERRQERNPIISGLKRISKPGKRIYAGYDKIRLFGGGTRGIIIVSTPSGVMTANEARKKKLGGEVIAEIW